MPTFLVTPTKAFVALAAFVGTHCLAARTLYLVAGSPSHGPETHAVVLYSLVNGKSTVIRTLVTEAEGSRNIHLNYEARRVVVTSSTEAPLTRISIVDMDHPDTELSIDLGQTGDFGVSGEGFLDVPGQGHLYYVSRGDVSTASQKAYAFNLEGSLELAPLPDRLLKFRRSFGYALFESDEFWIAYDPQSGAVTMRTPSDARSIDLLPPVPPALRTPGATWARIGACNSFMTALVLPDGRALVYSVRSGWMSPAPFRDNQVVPWRAIGPWLVAKVAKPQTFDPKSRPKLTKAEIELTFRRERWPTHVKTGQNDRVSERHLSDRFTDSLIVLNVDTGEHYRIKTGDANSEVLWIDQSAVYYRVNGSIYVQRVDAGALTPPELVAEGEEIWDVHWAFWSN